MPATAGNKPLLRWAAIALLYLAFAGVVGWFGRVDFYHRHFFDPGPIVAVDNLARIVFVPILAWLVYAPGGAIGARLMTEAERATLFPAERAIVGFGIGIGFWHGLLLLLGLAGLYDRSVMLLLCLVTLVGSTAAFGRVAEAAMGSIGRRLAAGRERANGPEIIGLGLVAVAAIWLLIVRGLYPGGGGDYFTHYFPYYLEVLKRHDLAPNDVWYHYYYSKGYGLFFLAMLVTDPEAPALVTFVAVAFAALAILALGRRLAPKSLWPACAALIYLLFYLVSLSPGGGGEFPKDHELVTALIALMAWGLCLPETVRSPAVVAATVSSGVAVSIIDQPVGVIVGVVIGFLAGWFRLRGERRSMRELAWITAAMAGAVLAIFALNYGATGLASDQALDLMLRFANFGRLDRWGVIPQIVTIAWIRDSYIATAPPSGWPLAQMLAGFMRLGELWPFLAGAAIAAAAGFAAGRPAELAATRLARRAATRLGLFVGIVAALAVAAGRVQNISFERLSTFFVPLLLMLGVATGGWGTARIADRRSSGWSRLALPIAALAGVLATWQVERHWTAQIMETTMNSLRFLRGRTSLAEAYSRPLEGPWHVGYPFGGINPGTLAAARQVPPDTPIWSTTTAGYCMVPGCEVESVVSFKMSGRLDEILAGPPERARQLLRKAGINYFLVMKDFQLTDSLAFSRLFAPDTIGRYLGIKWTDGANYLLTWNGPETRPIDHDFLAAYRALRTAPDNPWLMLRGLVPEIAAASDLLRSGAPAARAGQFPWRVSPSANGSRGPGPR